MTNQEFIDYLLSIGFEEKELIDVEAVSYNTISQDERWFTLKDISIFVHKDGTRLIYMDVDSVSIEGNTPKQCIKNALSSLHRHYECAREHLLEVKELMKNHK